MEAFFDRRLAEEQANLGTGSAEGTGANGTEATTPAPSGQSTPMYKGPAIGTKIKLNVAAARRTEIVDSEESDSAGGGDDDDDDDDY